MNRLPTSSAMSSKASSSAGAPMAKVITTKEALGIDMVDLFVGPDKVQYRVHKTLLCNKIPYFDKMFNSGFAEASTNSATFPEDDPESFDVLVGWVYKGALRPLTIVQKEDSGVTASWGFVDFYALAEKLCLSTLQDMTMDAIVKYHKDNDLLPSPQLLAYMYAKTNENSPLRAFAVRTYHWGISKKFGPPTNSLWDLDSCHELLMDNSDLAKDFLSLLKDGNLPRSPVNFDKSTYHCQGTDKA